ncbi:HNH endonuclease [Streptomyces lividans]|nr:HNH endonuclease [Streptomyces lividans]
MRRLDPPRIGTREAFRMCISAKISHPIWKLLSSYELRVVIAAGAYERACRTSTLHLLNPADFSPLPPKEDDKKALIAMYEQRMKPDKPGRPVYEEARNRKSKCPMCGVGSVRQVDHHMPKSIYPYLAAVPINLLPICSDCNFAKKDKAPTCYAEQTLHPYFDDVDDDRWLRARLITRSADGQAFEAKPLDSPANWLIEFYVDPPESWDTGHAERVRQHFKTFKLADLYEDQAADDLPGIEGSIEEAFQAGGAPDVRAHLLGLARTRARQYKNSWMAALYEALADNDWFCSGGFRQVAAG